MAKLKFDSMRSGDYIERKKDGVKLLVEDVMEEIRKVLVMDLSTSEEKELSASTIERFYTTSEAPAKEVGKIESDETELDTLEKEETKPVEEKEKPKGPKVRRPVRKAPRPKASPAKVEAKETAQEVVEEDVPEEKGKEEAEIEESKTKKPISLKSDTVLALSNKLQEAISDVYTDSVRVVTETYIGYRRKYVFLELFEMKRTLYINVRTGSMTEEDIAKLTKVYPKSYKWVLDGKFVIKSEEDIETAMELIEKSFHAITLK